VSRSCGRGAPRVRLQRGRQPRVAGGRHGARAVSVRQPARQPVSAVNSRARDGLQDAQLCVGELAVGGDPQRSEALLLGRREPRDAAPLRRRHQRVPPQVAQQEGLHGGICGQVDAQTAANSAPQVREGDPRGGA